MSTRHEPGAFVESDFRSPGSLGEWQALKDENLLDLDGTGGSGAAGGGLLEFIQAALPAPSLTAAASAAREAALGTADGRQLAIAGHDEEDTAVEANEMALAAAAIWTDVATAPGNQTGLARDWAQIDLRPAPLTPGELGQVSAAGVSAASAEGATRFGGELPAGVEIPPPMGAAILRGDEAALSLRVSIGRIAAGLVFTFVVGFAVGGWWLESRGRSFGSWAFAATGRPSRSSAAATASPVPSAAPVVEPIPRTPAPGPSAPRAPTPALSAAPAGVAEMPAVRPAAHRGRKHARHVIKLRELELTIPDLPPSP